MGTNWAGNHTYVASALAKPSSVGELQGLVARSERIRALGSRHSFSDLSDTRGVLVDLTGLPPGIEIDEEASSVSVSAGTRYGDLAAALDERGQALANMASLPHISVGGAVATGTHGSGDTNQSLSSAVRALEIVGPDGYLRRLDRADPDFDGSVVALGALGIVTRLVLDIEPGYGLRQDVSSGLTWATFDSRFDDLTAAGYSVSMFTRFGDESQNQLWVKARVDQPAMASIFGTTPAPTATHMLAGGAVEALTEQGGVPGQWLHRLPHFRIDFTPSRGEELQSEYFLPREHAVRAVEAIRRMSTSFRHLLQVAEIRTIAADSLWLSGAYGRETVAVHFTWVQDEAAVRVALREIEAALAPWGARPHWGKLFGFDHAALLAVFPRLTEFTRLRDRVDPDQKFGNAFLDRCLQ
ncbi:FAD-binding protein [Nostocoides sp. HKS02]|nr:FAD-binding protein [Tetrasphaera sp. HKS02]